MAQEKKKSNYLVPGLMAAAGAATYALFRKPFNPTKLQKASKGKLTWVVEDEAQPIIAGKNPVSKLIKNVLYGDTNVTTYSAAKKSKKLEGAVYVDMDMKYKRDLPKGDVNLNTDADVIKKTLQNKINFSKLKDPSGSIVPGQALDEFLGKPKTFEHFVQAVAKIKDRRYVKPSVDFASNRAGHYDADFLDDVATTVRVTGNIGAKHKRPLQRLFKHQSQMVIQPEVQAEKIRSGFDKGKPRAEFRTDFTVHGGKVDIINTSPRNADWPGGIIPVQRTRVNRKFVEDSKKILQGIVSSNKATFKGKSFALGADIVRDSKGKLRIIEMNDQSGYLNPTIVVPNWRPSVAHNFYKKVTGRDTKVVATSKALAASAITGAAATSQS